MTKRATLADALHQAGRRAEALERFREAEAMQAEWQPQYPLLYSLAGFGYCDLLLAEAERAAWRIPGSARVSRAGLGVPAETNFPEPSATAQTSPIGEPPKKVRSGEDAGASTRDACAPQIHSCREVEQRAALTLEWVTPQDWLLDIALDHLTLGRASLYRAILEQSPFDTCHASLEQAMTGLRAAGATHHVPRGLLTRAWLRVLEGHPAAARADLDEAQQIAERGSMHFHLADIHLRRARLFGNPKSEARNPKYPWQSPQYDLAAARRMIERHGYQRRLEELTDAEAAILGK